MIGPTQSIDIKVVSNMGALPTSHAVSIGLIVTELIMNSVKYAVPQPRASARIRVTFEKAGADWKLTVSDNGDALIGYVQQDIFLFAGDVATNIRLSNPLSDEEVVRAAKEVGADRIIRGFPRGYAQVLGERGASISVGERQLLSFARAVAANAARGRADTARGLDGR